VSIFNQYVIRVPKRDQLAEHLHKNNIGCEIYYPVPLHLQECFKHLGYKERDLPQAEKAAKEVLAIPIYPELTDRMKNYVAQTILAFFK
jgi:dTDP-4-amino-4,6-dideoxygalactose transaminase